MELNFLWRGAGFNPVEGSTSAYFIDNGEMFLIDCGESVFGTIIKKNILEKISALNVFITHTHADHVGSLGTLLLYTKTVKKITANIIIDKNMSYFPSIQALLRIYGLPDDMYGFKDSSVFDGSFSVFDKVRYIKTAHCNELDSCGILFETDKGVVFYSGDMNDPAPLMAIINSGRKIDQMFIDSDCSRKPSLHHISIHLLNDIIPPEIRLKIRCMHINKNFNMEEARGYGFKVVDI